MRIDRVVINASPLISLFCSHQENLSFLCLFTRKTLMLAPRGLKNYGT